MNKNNLLKLKLRLVPDIGPIRYNRLINYFGSAENIFNTDINTLCRVKGISHNISSNIIDKKNELDKQLEKELSLIHKHNIDVVFYNEKHYPKPLINIPNPPPVLYIKGKWQDQDEVSIAIVGTRHSSTYGSMTAQRFASDLAENGITIISGLARGIDTRAHVGALKTGRT
ncbi:DNA-processing protein DprA, partial [bacterium]